MKKKDTFKTGLIFIISIFVIICTPSFAFPKGKEAPAGDKDKRPLGQEEGSMKVFFTDPEWDGITVPEGQQCLRDKGNGFTPALAVKNIPPGTEAVIMEYSDRSYPPMDNGGHGKIGFYVQKKSVEINIPAVPGHTFNLDDGFFLVAAQADPAHDKAGAYMPPCCGGRGNSYYVTVKAVKIISFEDKKYEVLAEVVKEMGRY